MALANRAPVSVRLLPEDMAALSAYDLVVLSDVPARALAPSQMEQLATYVRELPMAFRFCVLTVASDGLLAKYGTPFTPLNHFAPWNVDDSGSPLTAYDTDEAGEHRTGLEVLIDGLFNVERFLQIVRDYVAFDATDAGLVKRIAKPHQYFAVTKAVGSTIDAVRSNGKAGVVWHTQGSGKSLTMAFYAERLVHRLHRHADRSGRRQHACGLR